MGMSMETVGKKSIIFHVIFDGTNRKIDEVIKKLEEVPEVQMWKVDDSEISIGKLPNIFKAIPLRNLSYNNGWLTIKVNEKMCPSTLYIVTDAKHEILVNEILKSLAPLARLRAKEVVG